MLTQIILQNNRKEESTVEIFTAVLTWIKAKQFIQFVGQFMNGTDLKQFSLI